VSTLAGNDFQSNETSHAAFSALHVAMESTMHKPGNLTPAERDQLISHIKQTLPAMSDELGRVDRAKKKGRPAELRSILNHISSLRTFLIQLTA
jgi:hypothetical protein